MGRAYGIDLRTRVVGAIVGGQSHRQAAERFCIAVSTAGNWHRLWRQIGSAKPIGAVIFGSVVRQPTLVELNRYRRL